MITKLKEEHYRFFKTHKNQPIKVRIQYLKKLKIVLEDKELEIYDDPDELLSLSLGSAETTSTPEAYASLYVLSANTGSATYKVKGNIRVDDSDESIWIYS